LLGFSKLKVMVLCLSNVQTRFIKIRKDVNDKPACEEFLESGGLFLYLQLLFLHCGKLD
jgi:hypothetical protein